MGKKNKLRLSLRRKKSFFGPKIGEKFLKKVQKLPNFKEKKDFSGQKKQAGAELKNKKRFFGTEVGEKLSKRAKN